MLPLLLVLPRIAAAPVPKELKAARTDAEAVIGIWVIVASNHHGKNTPGSVGIKSVFRGDGTGMILHQNNREHGPVKVTFEPKANPKTCSWVTWKGCTS